VVKQLTPAGWKAATNPQVLTNPDARDAVVQTAQKLATSHVQPGPQHDVIVQQIAHQVAQTLDQVFGALKLSLVIAIQHGLLTVLIFAGIMFVCTWFLKDLPSSQKGQADAESEAQSSPVPASR
jgi:hypothetical protein